MAIAEFNQRCEFNTLEQKRIEKHAEQMFKTDTVESYLPLGKKEVCLKRESVANKTIEVFLMNTTLEMNDEMVTRFNKRNKNKAGCNSVNS